MNFAHSPRSSLHSARTEHHLCTWPSARRGDCSVVWVDTGAPCLQGQSPAGPPGLRELMTSSLGPGPEWGACAYQRPQGLGGLRAGFPVISQVLGGREWGSLPTCFPLGTRLDHPPAEEHWTAVRRPGGQTLSLVPPPKTGVELWGFRSS